MGQATALPSPLANAASWDLSEAAKYGGVIGRETSAFGLNISLGGNVNLIGREPRDGRTFETGGEDPYLSGEINAQHLLGIQNQYVIAGVKHFALNDQETGRTQANAVIDERSAQESDLLAFQIALAGSNAQMTMCAYSMMNGVYDCQNNHLLNDVLKGEWSFPGYVLSDDYATQSSVPSALAGLDQEQSYGYFFTGIWTAESLQTALANGNMPASRLDNMVHRILRGMYAAGVFDHPATVAPINAAMDGAIAQEIEEQGAVLLEERQQPVASQSADDSIHRGHWLPCRRGRALRRRLGTGHSGWGAALTLPSACPPNLPAPGGMACTNASMIYDPSPPLAAIKALAPAATVTYNDGIDPAAAASLRLPPVWPLSS